MKGLWNTTANLDFAKKRKQHKEYLAYLVESAAPVGAPHVICNQEAKRIRLKRLLPDGWATAQRLGTAALRGSAVSWKEPLGVSDGKLHLLSFPREGKRVARMWPRFMLAVRTHIDGKRVTLISAHYPPLRYKWLWPQSDRRLAAVIKAEQVEGREVVVAADFNTHPSAVAGRLARLGARVHAVGDGEIDGFLHTPGLHLSKPAVNRYGIEHGLTDHPSVTTYITIKEKS